MTTSPDTFFLESGPVNDLQFVNTGAVQFVDTGTDILMGGAGYDAPTLESFIAAFDSNTISMVGNVELDGAMYVLSTKTLNTTNYRIDPDGTKNYLTSVTVTKIGNGQILEQNEIAQLYAGGLDSAASNGQALSRGAIGGAVFNGDIQVFFCEKDAGGSYGQSGYAYTIDAQTLASSSSSVFTNANWGWFPSIDSNGDVSHFSFAGYYMYKNTSLQYAIAPSEAALLAENQKLVTADLSGDLTTSISPDALSALLVDDLKAFVGTTTVNDTPGVVFTDATGLTVTEYGGTASFEVALQAVPRHDVILTFTISDASEGSFASSGTSTLSLTFTPENWSTAQTVTLVGVDDKPYDSNMTFVVSTSVSSDDLRYDGMRSGTGLSIANIVVTNTDNDVPDELYGDAGGVATADLLYGGYGASDIYGKDGRDEMYGGNGDDRLYGGYGDDVLYGEADNDELEGDQGNDKLNGGTGNDTLTGGTGKDTLLGGDGNDTLDGSSDADSMNGGNGADTYYVDNTGDIISDSGTDTGKDTVYVTAFLATGYTLGAGIDNAMLQAQATNAALTGNTGNNTLTGNASDNALNGGAGNDSLNGGDGLDNLTGGDGADNLSGGLGNDILYAGSGDDVVDAGDGNDLIVGGDGAGNDRYTGGAGVDTVKYTSATAAITVNLTSSTATGTNIGSDTLAQIENVIGGKGSDSLTGNTLANSLTGDTGNDTINGGAGADNMTGGDGSDTYYVDNISDVVSETNAVASTGGTDTVYSYLSAYTLGTNVENGRILSAGTASLTGNASNNTLYAAAGNNALNGGSGTDTASYAYATVAVKVSLALTTGQITGGSGTDTLTGIENLVGGSANDSLTGSTLANSLSGGAGNDILYGRAGSDVLNGGLGIDQFVFDTTLGSSNVDTLADFVHGSDKIVLDDDIFTKLGITGTSSGAALTPAKFQLGAANDSGDRIIYNQTSGALYYDADGSGVGGAVQIALIGTTTHTALTAADFLVVA